MVCSHCGAENRPGRKFCAECGGALTQSCPACGAANEPGDRFCGDCGTALERTPTELAAATPEPVAERRLVSVLFADLVGFTSRSEDQDPEEVRDLLSRYFDEARQVIERYGGTVEKFIGDAVMAVWGTPVAQEDDAERAVRAALDLVAVVPDLDARLQARAGVLTGEAAVTVGAQEQGMVAGDLVNTASRIQGAAPVGTVFVGEATRRASEAAIAYEEAGTRELKGKEEAVPLWRALRVTATRGGALKSVGLEPPFVGRGRELRLVKELFNACIEERTAHLVSVIATAGNGKSRLAWEFQKYTDGITALILAHRGRCLAYGEGVTYWALAEMVRMRAGIAEGEEAQAARAKLRRSVEEFVSDPNERAWVEPRLAQLLGLEERQVHEREDLFAGWRLFVERMGEQDPVLMVFDDMQWADASLLEFVEYLLEWSRSYPIFILTLARPELVERNPQWGAGKRNFTSISLEPLSPPAMEELLSGLVPGLPGELRAEILNRAEGVPLYAVETVRMLLDRGLLARAGDVYQPTGAIEALDVPETLHALIAARLDGLEPGERRVVQDASVLGKTFTKQALAALCSTPEDTLESLLSSLVRKEVVSIQADPRSPERGQYGFVQDLLKRVAYETLARKERKARHLAAATYLEEAFGPAEQEVVEVVSAHYVGAFEAAPDDDDAPTIKDKARETLTRAGERAGSLAASEEAARYFAQAAELANDARTEAALRERAGERAAAAGRVEEARTHYERAIELFHQAGETHPAARVSARLGGEVDWVTGSLEQTIERMEPAFAVLSGDKPDADFAMLAAQLGRAQYFAGNTERASEVLETAVRIGEALVLPEVLSQAMNTQAVIAAGRGHRETAQAFFAHSLKLALDNDLPTPALRAYNNLSDDCSSRDRYEEALDHLEKGIALARRVGNRVWEWQLLLEVSYSLVLAGRWDDAIACGAEIPEAQLAALPNPSPWWAVVEAERGRAAEARHALAPTSRLEGSIDVQQRAIYQALHAVVLRSESRHEEALVAAEDAWEARRDLGAVTQFVKCGFVYAVEAAFALGRLEKVDELLEQLDTRQPAEQTALVRANGLRFRARLAAARGDRDSVEPWFKAAEATFREFGIPFWLAVTQLEHGEWLADQGRPEEAQPRLSEAREIFQNLAAAPWLERATHALRPAAEVEVAASTGSTSPA